MNSHPKEFADTATETTDVASSESIERLLALRAQFLRFLLPRVEDAATAEDILQAAFVRAIEHEADLREGESVVAWFYRILRNAVIDHYRRAATRSKALEEFGSELSESYEPELKAEVCACLGGVVRDLKPEYREALEEVDLGGATIEAFAQSQHTTTNNASVRLHRARKAAAKRLMTVCGTCAEHKCVDCTCRARQL